MSSPHQPTGSDRSAGQPDGSMRGRIAAVLRAHMWDPHDEPQPWAEHLADALITELGLVEEQDDHAPISEHHRYVTPWENTDD